MDELEENTQQIIGVPYGLYHEALKFAFERGEVSSPNLQRKFSIPYSISARLMDLLRLNKVIEEERSVNGGYRVININTQK